MAGRTVLIVDGEARFRRSLRMALEARSFRVLEAGNALEALWVCACRPIDLLVTEMEMPGIDGARLAEKFTARFPGTPVLYTKSRDPELLDRTVAELLGGGGPRRQPAHAAAAAPRQRSA